ncbi:DUF5092 domain-containing protein [Candidatus Dependentiae bacterium]|nr:DUF5092 domain-containing protein [Candidatus Dependentiae bacterium]
MKKQLLLFMCSFICKLICMETSSTTTQENKSPYTPFKRIVEYNKDFNPQNKKAEIHRSLKGALNIKDKEHFTQKTFLELIKEHEEECTPFLIARVETSHQSTDNKCGFRVDYYDAYNLLCYLYNNNVFESWQNRYFLEVEQIKKNIHNLKPMLGLIKFYQISSVNDLDFNYIGSDCDLHYYTVNNTISEYLRNLFKHEIARYEVLDKALLEKAEYFIQENAEHITNGDLDIAIKILQKITSQNLPESLRASCNLAIIDHRHCQDQKIKDQAFNFLTEIANKKEEDPIAAEIALNYIDNAFKTEIEELEHSAKETVQSLDQFLAELETKK